VTLIEAAPRLLPAADPRAAAIIAQALTADGVQVRTATAVEKVSGAHNDGGISLGLTGPGTMAADQLLVAAGRVPVTGGLGLAAAGSVPGVIHAHARARWTGRTLRVEIEGWIDPDTTTREADALGRQVADALARRLPKAGSLTWTSRVAP
jgi:hypothetical protein